MNVELINGLLGFVFTLMIFSYLLGDNPLFRSAAYIFVGSAAGYIAAVAFGQVLWPNLLYPLLVVGGSQNLPLLVPLIMTGLLLMKAWPRTTHMGAPVMAYLVGAGAAAAVGGSVIGTLSPQMFATINAFDPRAGILALITAVVILVGVASTLAYFHFSGRTADDGSVQRFVLIEWIAWPGRVFIAITLGVVFAGVYIAALTALVERLTAVRDFLASLI
jgi:hypothetical protein